MGETVSRREVNVTLEQRSREDEITPSKSSPLQ
ncbi:MAG: hypothetical protein ACI8QF_004100, partial [Limisphaerales bacterium]